MPRSTAKIATRQSTLRRTPCPMHPCSTPTLSLHYFLFFDTGPFSPLFLNFLLVSHLSQPASTKSSPITKSLNLNNLAHLVSRTHSIHPARRRYVVKRNHSIAKAAPATQL